MSLIDLLKDDNKWDEFLSAKIDSSCIPDSIKNKYSNFIKSRKYKDVVLKIINEDYIFLSPKKVLIGKSGKSKKRAVYIFEEVENYILKMISYFLYDYDYLFSPNLYSFRKNSGVRRAIFEIMKVHKVNKMYGYKVDISNYFNSIPVSKLLESLNEDLNDEKLYRLISNILLNDKVIFNGNEISDLSKGIMAGMPISSFLANYYLKDLDKYFYDNNILYARYADDIIVFSDLKERIENHSRYIKDYLNEKGLKVNQDKEYYYEKGDIVEFLGFSFNGSKIDISKNTFKKIKGKIRRTSRGLRRWMIKNNASLEVTLKAMNRKYNRKFFGKNENDLTWKYWFFPIINTDVTIKKVDKYMQNQQRYIASGRHNKKNFEKVPYNLLKQCGYKSLVHEYYIAKG